MFLVYLFIIKLLARKDIFIYIYLFFFSHSLSMSFFLIFYLSYFLLQSSDIMLSYLLQKTQSGQSLLIEYTRDQFFGATYLVN